MQVVLEACPNVIPQFTNEKTNPLVRAIAPHEFIRSKGASDWFTTIECESLSMRKLW